MSSYSELTMPDSLEYWSYKKVDNRREAKQQLALKDDLNALKSHGRACI
ncbi:hypothetical protein [Nostoc sp. ATCC 53789]|nr:hypothetical protein [Nostoc sp. ATCC 53789]QHG18880.1 hypothetical protein GJB62_24880 [Nostoc sp. ATCC 53789]